MQALKITGYDATCLEASWDDSPVEVEEWAAVPDAYGHACSVECVSTKGSSYIAITFPDGEVEIIKEFSGVSPEEALQEASNALWGEGAVESDLVWWEFEY